MKKDSKVKQSPKRATATKEGPRTIGMDLGDRTSRYCVLAGNGERWGEGSVSTTKKAMAEKFQKMPRGRVAMEVGTHSPWVSRLLSNLGFEVTRGQCAAGAVDQCQLAQERSGGCADVSAAGTGGSGVVAAHPAPERAGAGGPAEDPGAGDAGGDAHGAD